MKFKIVFLFLFLGLILHTLAQSNNKQPFFNKQPLQQNAKVQLPLGSIKAKGWLLKQLEQQRDGATGMAEELYNGDNHLGKNTDWLGGTGNSWEKVPYYVKGLISLAYTLNDTTLKQKVQKYIDWTLDSQQENGLFGPPKMKDWWPRMPMMYALQSYYEATNDKRVIPFLSKYFKFQLTNLDADPLKDWGKARAADNIEIALWLYNRNGDKSLLQLAEKLKQQSYQWIDIFSNNQFFYFGADFHPKHMVNVAQALKYPLIYAQLSKNPSHSIAMQKGITHLMNDHGLPVGLSSGTEFLAGNSSIQGVETCTVVEWMQSLETAARFVDDVSIGDGLEKVAFNSLPAQFDRVCKNHSYYTLPNQVISIKGGLGFNQDYNNAIISSPYSGFECCRYNMHMGWPYFVKNSWLATPEKGLAALTYGPMEINTYVNDHTPIKITSETNYPFDDLIYLNLELKNGTKFPLKLRIPAWCNNPTVSLNGKKLQGVKKGEMFVINRVWTNKDQVMLKLPMDISVKPQVNNSVSIERGPLVYALKIDEEQKIYNQLPVKGFFEYEILPKTAWNYGLLDVEGIGAHAKIIKTEMPDNPFDYQVTPIKIKLKAKKIPSWHLSANKTAALDVPFSPLQSGEPTEEIILVPYGSENLRLSCFPVIGNKNKIAADYSENFENGMPKNWVFYGGGWFTKEGKMFAASNASSFGAGIRGPKILNNANQYGNFTYKANVKLTTDGDAGLIFRVNDAAIGPDAYKGYYVGLNPQRSAIEFGKADNNWKLITSSKLNLEKNRLYELKVIADGENFEFFLDNQSVLKAKDDSYKNGSIGLRTYNAEAMFDNVQITAR